jgi:hypothetical protein
MPMDNGEGSFLLINKVLDDQYSCGEIPYEYIFFKIPPAAGGHWAGIELDLGIQSGKAVVVLNEYLGSKPVTLEGKSALLPVNGQYCETGENILAYKGQVEIRGLKLIPPVSPLPVQDCAASHCPGAESLRGAEAVPGIAPPVRAAAQFLLDSRISNPRQSPFRGSCYAVYDYTNGCYRMAPWLWSDAPAVSAMLSLARKSADPALRGDYERLALGIGETFLRTRISDPQDEIYGALVSRYRYYGKTNRSFDKLCGMNDTSFSVKWALLPLYLYTGDTKYLDASRLALDWVEKNLRNLDFVPSHYYHEDRVWENRAFVDTGFCAEGFDAFTAIEKNQRYKESACFLTDRFLAQFKLPGGLYGQNFVPPKGVDDRLFTRGQAWVLEGLLACYRMTGEGKYLKEARALGLLLIDLQKDGGEWSYLLGYGVPREAELKGSGICEKATAVLSWLFSELYRLSGEACFRVSALRGIAWCEKNMAQEAGAGGTDGGAGYGGIRARSLASGITGLPFLEVATGYANAFYILAKLNAAE